MSNSTIETIKKRISVRTFENAPLSTPEQDLIRSLCTGDAKGPFGGTLRVAFLDPAKTDSTSLKSVGTYGIIRHAPLFIGAIVKPVPGAFVDLGYLFERILLKLTANGFGTCWLGGTFTRSSFAERARVEEGEILGIISPVGRPHRKRSLMDTMIRTIAGSRNRKPWDELFFEPDSTTPLPREKAGNAASALECVRIGPSASNKQPWRLIKRNDTVHFYLARTPGYSRMIKNVDLQAIDIGIAMCHFEIAALECGISGSWKLPNQPQQEAGWEYVAGFIMEKTGSAIPKSPDTP